MTEDTNQAENEQTLTDEQTESVTGGSVQPVSNVDWGKVTDGLEGPPCEHKK